MTLLSVCNVRVSQHEQVKIKKMRKKKKSGKLQVQFSGHYLEFISEKQLRSAPTQPCPSFLPSFLCLHQPPLYYTSEEASADF